MPPFRAGAAFEVVVLSFGFPLLAKSGIRLLTYIQRISLYFFFPQAGGLFLFVLKQKGSKKFKA